MRTTLLVCAAVANIAMGAQLQAQNCAMPCRNCPDPCQVSEISIMFENTQCGCNQCACNRCGCDQCRCDQVGCGEVACQQVGCGEADCEQVSCGQAGCAQSDCNRVAANRDDCDPYTYYQLREDWRNTHGPILDTIRYVHQSCPKKHHHKHNGNEAAYRRASQTPWHGNYYYPQWGVPVALVVPPTAEFQTNYSWGVPASRISPIDHQFSRSYPGYGSGVVGTTGFLPPPQQPSDTNQFGVYYVRGPW